MLKKVVAVLLIALAGGAWLYLDHLNKQEQILVEQNRQAMMQARAEAAARAEARAKFEAEILASMNECKAQADQVRADFLTQKQQPVRRKPGQFPIPETAITEADATLNTSYADCQLAHDARFAQGY